MQQLVAVALGGALGATLRYAVVRYTLAAYGPYFPWGTLVVNLLGSAVLAFLVTWSTTPDAILERQPTLRLFVTVGLLGALTTYSSFNVEVLQMLETGHVRRALTYGGATIAGALVLGALGAALGRLTHP